MGRAILLCTLALTVCACRPAAQRSAAIPQADTPASPGEPASAPAPALTPDFSEAIDLAGPAWTLKIRRNSLALSRPGRIDVMSGNPGPTLSNGSAAWDTVAVGQGGALKVVLRPGPCSVGTTGPGYPYQATVETAGETLTGCAAPAGS
jgi:uncharacterized membrane protein